MTTATIDTDEHPGEPPSGLFALPVSAIVLLVVDGDPSTRRTFERAAARVDRIDLAFATTVEAGCRLLTERRWSGLVVADRLADGRGADVLRAARFTWGLGPIWLTARPDDGRTANFTALSYDARLFLAPWTLDDAARAARFVAERHVARLEAARRMAAGIVPSGPSAAVRRELLAHLAVLGTLKSFAAEAGVSVRTAQRHARALVEALELGSLTDLVALIDAAMHRQRRIHT